MQARAVVVDAVLQVQEGMQEMLDMWKGRAAGGMSLERERLDKAEWMRLVVRAWGAEAKTSRRARRQQQQGETTEAAGDRSAGRGEMERRTRQGHGERAGGRCGAAEHAAQHTEQQRQRAGSEATARRGRGNRKAAAHAARTA